MKKQSRKNKLQELDKRMQELQKRRVQAYMAGMSQSILDQLDRMTDELQIDMYTETELQRFRAQDKGDGEDFIV